MMYRVFCTSFLLGSLALSANTTNKPKAILPDKHYDFIDDYCIDCHDSSMRKGKVDLEELDFNITTVEQAEHWQKVLNAINAKEMPPEDKDQPEDQEKADFLADLSETLVVARSILSDSSGVSAMRRLNRREYENTIYDVLGIKVDADELPSDFKEESYDTLGAGLYMSSDQIKIYRKSGRDVLNAAIDLATKDRRYRTRRIDFEEERNRIVDEQLRKQLNVQYRYKQWKQAVDKVIHSSSKNRQLREKIKKEIGPYPEYSFGKNHFYYRWDQFEGAPSPKEFGFADAYDALHWYSKWEWLMPQLLEYSYKEHRDTGVYLEPAGNVFFNNHFHIHNQWPNGEYKVAVVAGKTSSRELEPTRKGFDKMIIDAPTEDRAFLDLDSLKLDFTIETKQVTGTIESPEPVEFTISKTPGKLFAFILRERGFSEGRVAQMNQKLSWEKGVIHEASIWVDYVEISGPFYEEEQTKNLERLKKWVRTVERDSSQFKAVSTEFARAMMRGQKPSAYFMTKLEALFNQKLEKGVKVREAMVDAWSVVLSSPRFVYLSEKPSEDQKISDLELGNRLSYFLSAGPPDAQLSAAIAKGELSDANVLKAHTERLLKDPKLNRFTEAFLEQWLGLDRLDFFQFDTKKHQDYTVGVKRASRHEIFETFLHWLREGEGLGHLLSSDTIVINPLLANFYGIEGVHGGEFRPVKVPSDSPRGGLLGMAAVNAMGGNGKDSSPVERGAWVLRKLMNNPPPPAPPNIPQLSRLEKEPLSTREMVSMHQEEAQCAQCHRKIDPIGFGLENFNAVGKWRVRDDRHGVPHSKRAIDPAGKIYGGSEFKDFFELRTIIRDEYLDAFAKGFTENLAEYALGRKIGFTDQTWIEEVLEKSKKEDYSIESIIHGLIQSEAFRRKR